MLKKSLYLPLVCALPLTTYAGNLSTEQHQPSQIKQVFPSKTYFLMAVDNEIKSTIKYDDIGQLLGLPSMSEEDAETVFFGMRKSMLRYAARAWDAGVAVHYGKDVGGMVGLEPADSERFANEDSGVSQFNKLLLFRYAQQYPESKQLLQQYQQRLNQEVAKIEVTPSDFSTYCAQLESYTDFTFYRSLGQLSAAPSRVYSVTKQYEMLPPCKKRHVENLLSSSYSAPSLSDFLMVVSSNSDAP
ncbi:hypothetical protein MGA5115_00866 [Marinomonas gallaica]|uniref:Uncharacterized protein n=1 Tax=Marinomonas gallaica TaxID=1806667 RepID=A0A1C3JNJ9_9GAMM|nr:hypothetical protein [Marinomonas gallaica]SBT16782.1 hypothetical protein MGA5115_00866 [Marinomonas gallaica]SBT20498.1 hypothetical protein MGA5116_01084 [Marinomonas gallaica]